MVCGSVAAGLKTRREPALLGVVLMYKGNSIHYPTLYLVQLVKIDSLVVSFLATCQQGTASM